MTDRPASLTPDLPQHLLTALRELIAQGRQRALRAVDMVQVQTCWEVGRHIVEFEQGGENRAAYGKRLLVQLGQALTQEFGKGFDATNLRHMRAFYLSFPKCDALRRELSWTHYRLLLRVEHPSARDWYMHEAAGQNWSTRALERQIGTLYYERLLESSLEQALMDKLQHFLLELGKGFAFVARQQRISTETQDFYIDLVFYNYLLKCFVLIDLKTGHLTHQDIGQMVRLDAPYPSHINRRRRPRLLPQLKFLDLPRRRLRQLPEFHRARQLEPRQMLAAMLHDLRRRHARPHLQLDEGTRRFPPLWIGPRHHRRRHHRRMPVQHILNLDR